MGTCAIAASLPDEELVRLCRGGEQEAFSRLYERYHRPVMSTALRIIRNPEDAQDATQEIFLKVYRSLAEWKPEKARLSTWLYRLAANHAIDHWRVRHRRDRRESLMDPSEEGPYRRFSADSGTGPYLVLERKEINSQIRDSIRRLPQLQRRLFILRHIYEFRLEEIARIEGRSLGTVKGLLFRASRTIRRLIRS